MKLSLVTLVIGLLFIKAMGQDAQTDLLTKNRWMLPVKVTPAKAFESKTLNLTNGVLSDTTDPQQPFFYLNFIERGDSKGIFEIVLDTTIQKDILPKILAKNIKLGLWERTENQLLFKVFYPSDTAKPKDDWTVSEKHTYTIVELTTESLKLKKLKD